jgi:hypothetical protein
MVGGAASRCCRCLESDAAVATRTTLIAGPPGILPANIKGLVPAEPERGLFVNDLSMVGCDQSTDSTGYSSSASTSLKRSTLVVAGSYSTVTYLVGMSTRTLLTPASGVNASLIVFSQWPHEMVGTLNTVVAIRGLLRD